MALRQQRQGGTVPRLHPVRQIVDQRNSEPTVRIFRHEEPWPYINVGLDVDIPNAADIQPYVGALGFQAVQPYKLVMVGEKSSLEDVLGPIAENQEADLYLPLSDTRIYQMAQIGATDGRPMVVLYFSDADPAGWQMPISVARKLQAMRVSLFPDLDVQVFLDKLHALEEAPWSDLRGNPLLARGLSGRLRKYEVHSKSVRIGDKTAEGYRREWLYDLWIRYLPPVPRFCRHKRHNVTVRRSGAGKCDGRDGCRPICDG
jgi:Protein of unknown function (DUF3631)